LRLPHHVVAGIARQFVDPRSVLWIARIDHVDGAAELIPVSGVRREAEITAPEVATFE
jgi:hypothetical protein